MQISLVCPFYLFVRFLSCIFRMVGVELLSITEKKWQKTVLFSAIFIINLQYYNELIAVAAPMNAEMMLPTIPTAEQMIPAIAIPGFFPVAGSGF